MIAESPEKILYNLIFIFLNKKTNRFAEYKNKLLIFKKYNTPLLNEFNTLHIFQTYSECKSPFIKMISFPKNPYLKNDILDFIKLIISDNVLTNVIIEFEKELLREF